MQWNPFADLDNLVLQKRSLEVSEKEMARVTTAHSRHCLPKKDEGQRCQATAAQ